MQTRYAGLSALVVDDHPFQLLAAEQLLTQLRRQRGAVRRRRPRCAGPAGGTQVRPRALRYRDAGAQRAGHDGRTDPAQERAFAGAQPLWVWVSALQDDIIESHVSLADPVGLSDVRAIRKPISAGGAGGNPAGCAEARPHHGSTRGGTEPAGRPRPCWPRCRRLAPSSSCCNPSSGSAAARWRAPRRSAAGAIRSRA
ncbi:hypothetical protein ACU4GD_38875 [Cupriavidus basilensis]